ncbi:MAG: DUF3848 domain-containing protein [Oribacterium sp.]|nr:DUF3848 domain-containing protein [Oribacterium sp.]
MTEYVNKDYYKSLAVADRFYINPGNMTRPFMDRLNAEGIPFSATLGDYKQTVTVCKANRERAEGILYSLNAVQEAQPPQSRRNNNIIGNTEYNSITDKRYIKTDAETARNIEQSLKNSGNILFSGIIRGNTATITVSGDENAAAIRSMIDNMKYGTLLADLAAAGFDRVTNDSFFKEGFIVLRNRATGEQCGFDGFDMIRSMWEDPENEYFHPPIYKIVRDSEKLDYYISERYPDTDNEKDVYYERNGNVPTFDSIDEAVRYVQRNNIAVTNTAEELNDLRVDEITRRELELEKSNTKLIAQFPHNNDMYPDDFMFYPENGKYDWIYFNPDGDGGRGVFNYSRMTEDDIYNAYKAYKAEDDADKARQAFFSYLYNYANTEIINTRNEEFRGYANGYIRKPTMAERYYGLLEKGGDTVEIDRFIHINELRNKYITADYDRSNGVFLEDIDLRTANAEQRNAYRRSMESNIRCAEAIADAIHNYYGFRSENVLDTETALADVMGRFTPERVAYVLAVTINDRGGFDKRISGPNNEWAKSLLANIPDLYTSVSNRSVLSIRSQLGETHTGLINLLVDEFEKQYRDISLFAEKDAPVDDRLEESISDKVSREYKEYLENIRKESVDVIIRSVNEIAEKEKITQYFEEHFDENSFWEKDLEVLRNATHLLEDVYEVWADSPNLSSVDDVRIAVTTAIEYGKIRYEKPAVEGVHQEEPQIPLAEQVVQRLQDEMAEFNAEMLKNDPSAILSRITEISAKREIADYDVIGDYNLDTNRLTALLTSKNILDEVYQEWLSLDTNGLQDIGIAFEECADGIMESMKREQAETIEPEMQEDTIEPEINESVVPEQPETAAEEPVHDKHYYFDLAQKYINEFCDREYGSTADFSDIHEVGIGYTTVTDDEIELQVNADLENYQIKYYLDKRLYKTEDYDSLQELTENALSALDFNELAYEVEKDGDEAILAFVNVDTMITVPEHGISFDIAKIDEFVIEGSYSEYIGGMDENGHEAKDNYQQYDTSLSLRLEGAKVISEIYDDKDMFSPYTEDVFDLMEEGGRDALTDHINGYINDNDTRRIYTIKNGTETPLELNTPVEVQETEKTQPPFGVKNDHQAIVAAPPGSLDCILRNGCNDEHSLERIAVHFMKDKTNAENAEFLAKEFGVGGRGYIIGDDTVAAWFGKEGITFAEGDTAFPVGFNSFVPWEDAAERLRTLLENGQYCSQEILDAAPEYEINQIAETIWYLHQDLEEDVEFFLENEYFSSGFPNDTEKMASELHDPEFCKKIAEGFSEFAERYAADSEILRFHFHKPDEILSRVQDLMKPNKVFKAQPDIHNDTKFFITEDEKDQIIMEGSSISDGKYRINAFFSDDHGEKAQVEFLKAEYGTGGTGRTGFSEWHDAKGIGVQKKAANGEICEYTFKWNEVARRISRLVSEGKYYTEKDAADHERHLEWEKEHDSETVSAPVFRPTFEIYQVKEGSEYRDVRFASMDELEHFGHTVDKANYDHVYTGALSSIESPDKLPGIVEKFNIGDIPSDYNGRSISMGDVIVINTEAGSTAHYIDRIGYKDVSDIFIEPVRQQKQETAEEKTETSEEKSGVAVTSAEAMIMWQAGIAVHNENGALPAYSPAVKTNEMFSENHTFSVSIQENDLFRIADNIASNMQAISDEHHGDNFDLPNMHKAIKWADWNDNANVYENTIASLFKEDYYGITAYTVNVMGFSDDEEQGQKAKEALELIEDFKTAFGKVTLIAPAPIEESAPTEDKGPITLHGVGDFFELYGQDARNAAEVLNIHLIRRNGDDMCGFPVSQKDTYSDKLREAGYTVLIAETYEIGVPKQEKEPEKTISEDSQGLHIDGYTDTWSVINNMTYGGKELYLLENDEVGDETPYLIVDSDMNVLFDEGYSFDDFTANFSESDVAGGLLHGYYSDIVKDMGLQHSCITFAVVTFDDDKTVIMDSGYDEDDIYESEEFLDYVASTGKTKVEVSFEYYVLGADVEAVYATERQKAYILEHLDDVTAEATSLEGSTFTARVPEEEPERDDDYEIISEDSDIPSDYDEPEVSEENDDISEDIEEQEPVTETKSGITADELSIGDKFRLRGREYTIVSMDDGIYPDDVVISKIENTAGASYSVTENIDKFRLIREGEYLGNPDKEAAKQAEYTPRIGDLIELDSVNLYSVEDISGDEITFREMDTLFADTLKMPLSDLYTHDFKVINENDLYRYEEPEYDIFGDPIRRAPEDSKETAQPVFEHTAEKQDETAAEAPVQPQVNKGTNFVITDEHFGEAGGEKSRYADNVAAIRTLKLIESEERTATPEEQKILSKYTGWGAISQVFNSNNEKWSKEYEELRGLLTDAEYTAARKSTMNAHYTSPTVINAIYAGLEKLGFKSGRILEPAMGIGNFFGRLPETMANSRLTGVELDSLTGRIAQQLYPNANIQIKGFEKTGFSDNSFDVAVGNVPFGDYKLHDRRYDENNFFIHDFFFAKALDKVRPGGIVAFVTSKGTLDKENSKVREYIAQRAELLGAIRLPNNAFKANAGTEVTSDIIFLQKRERPIMIDPESVSWLHKSENADGLSINSYLVEHPEMVLGKIVEGNKLYGDQTKETSCEPIPGAVLSEQLAEAVKHIEGQYIPADITQDVKIADEVPAPPDSRKYSFYAVNGELYYRQEGDTMTRFKAKSDIEKRALGMIAVRDTMRELLDLQLNNADGTLDSEIADKRAELNEIYAEFTRKYGYISDPKNEKAFKGDDGYHLISGLEIKDEKSGTIHKADIFTKNTVKPKIIATHVDSAQEALILSVSEKAKVDFDYMTELTGMDKEKLISELQGQIFRLPQQEEVYVTADEYLTGNIRKKIEALSYAPTGMDVSEHRKALEAAMPPRLEAKDISVRLGAHWVDPMYIQQFILEKFHPDYKTRTEMQVQYSKTAGTWKIEGVSQTAKKNYTATDTYGTKRMHAYAILEGILNNSSLQVKDHKLDENGMEIRDDKGNYVLVVNEEETKAVNIVAKAIKAEFEDWIFKDPVRREALVDKYNEIYNSIRQREYDGSHLNFVGMNADITLRDHQKNAIARALYGGNTLLAHCVGAGKTYEMIAIAMEGKRLGQHNKTLFAVPNALTEQIGQDFLRLYPGANILVATKKDFETKNRKNLLARIAANDYDAVIVGHSHE